MNWETTQTELMNRFSAMDNWNPRMLESEVVPFEGQITSFSIGSPPLLIDHCFPKSINSQEHHALHFKRSSKGEVAGVRSRNS